jgi:hypothetical protein
VAPACLACEHLLRHAQSRLPDMPGWLSEHSLMHSVWKQGVSGSKVCCATCLAEPGDAPS